MSAPAVSFPNGQPPRVRARRLGLDTQYEAVVFMHKHCAVCRSEGFSAHNRILLRAGDRQVIATLYQVTSDLVRPNEAALSEAAWLRLGLDDGALISVSHPDPLESLAHVRSRIYGNRLSETALQAIITDVVSGRYSDIHLSAFISACATRPLDHGEILALTRAMVEAGERLFMEGQGGGGQALGRRPRREPDHPDRGRHCCRPWPHHAQDLLAGDHVTGRDRGYHGDAGSG